MGDQWLSDTIEYERDIKPYHFVAIYSGVGSGKNRFVDSFYKVDPQIPNPQMTVLIITSRRAKVDEILNENDVNIKSSIGRWGNLHKVKSKEETEEEFKKKYKDHLRVLINGNQKHFIYQKSVVCTNAFIEKYMQYIYKPDDITTHLWELFDMIVVDEVHSLILDASYQSAPFYVNDMIKEYLYRYEQGEDNYHLFPKCKHLILMTGTPEHMNELCVGRNENLHVLDRREECKNVVPKNIYFMKSSEVKKQLEEKLIIGEKSIYFSQSITKIKKYYDDISIDDKSVIALSFSNQERREGLSEKEKEKMEETEKSIQEKRKLPDTVQLLLSTERNKEGINIDNKDIINLYVESKHMGDIVQMAGRVRAGVENMYVVLDGGMKTEDVLMSYDARFSFSKLVESPGIKGVVNDFWKEVCAEHGSELFNNRYARTTVYKEKWSSDFIEYVHNTFPFIRYSYFQNCFLFYENRWNGLWDYAASETYLNSALERGGLTEKFKKWFPNSTVHPCEIIMNKTNVVDIEHARAYILKHMQEGEKYSVKQRDEFLKELNHILKTDYKLINSLFKHYKFGCQLQALTKKGTESKKKPKDQNTPFYSFIRE